jgi:hypothetical protein
MPVLPDTPQFEPPPLKVRTYRKGLRIDRHPQHSCVARGSGIALSGVDRTMAELELRGARSVAEDIEIGSLPDGIDITFLNNAGYEFKPSKHDGAVTLYISNQPGSQTGNFSIPIIYTNGTSTTICQINVINTQQDGSGT